MNKILIYSLVILALFSFFFYQKTQEKVQNELRNKIGQMLIVGFRGIEANEDSSIIKAIKELNLGGVILFDRDNPSNGEVERNIKNPEQTKNLINQLKEYPSLFIAVDAEGGLINRLKEKYGFENIPSAEEMGKGSLEETKENALKLGKTLKELGFNLDFAPVVDVNTNPQNPVIGKLERSFSDDENAVFNHALSFIAGLHQNNIITSIKHFPGHGSSSTDSHLGMVDVTNSYQEKEIIPYQKLIEGGYSDIVMTAHIINRNIDPEYPATLSPIFLKNILRDNLNFQGVIISDDMQMNAIVDNYGFEESIIKAINAGCNILIISNNGKTYNEDDFYRAVNTIFEAVKNGEIKEDTINDSYQKIQSLKEKYNI